MQPPPLHMRTHATIRLADQYAVRRIFDILQKDDWKAVLYSYYTRNEDALFAVRAHYSSLFLIINTRNGCVLQDLTNRTEWAKGIMERRPWVPKVRLQAGRWTVPAGANIYTLRANAILR
jgi:hypothetical protein